MSGSVSTAWTGSSEVARPAPQREHRDRAPGVYERHRAQIQGRPSAPRASASLVALEARRTDARITSRAARAAMPDASRITRNTTARTVIASPVPSVVIQVSGVGVTGGWCVPSGAIAMGRSSRPLRSPPMHVYLETPRLILRRFTADDLDDLVALDADPAVMRYINGGRATTLEEMRDDYLPWWLAYYERGDAWGFWAATERESGRFLGWFHLRPLAADPPDEPELGYRLVRDAWGRGLATEGSRALIDKAFAELGARRVHASTMAINTGSRRVMEKSGMRFVRLFHGEWPERIPGDEEGDVEYAITREEWEADRAPPGAEPA
jgi:RimJ/RimL family protein N-acetyltransferase